MFSQNVAISVHQDAKLGILGDEDKDYDALTPDIMARFRFQGSNDNFVVMGEYEYADLQTPFRRYAVNVGYLFERYMFDFKVDFQPYIGYGWIDHDGSRFNWNTGLDVRHTMNRFTVIVTNQVMERSDIDKIMYSLFLGVEFRLTK